VRRGCSPRRTARQAFDGRDQPEELLEALVLFLVVLWPCAFLVAEVLLLALLLESARAGTAAMVASNRVDVASAMMVFLTNPPRSFVWR
jgi:hypothetical protein